MKNLLVVFTTGSILLGIAGIVQAKSLVGPLAGTRTAIASHSGNDAEGIRIEGVDSAYITYFGNDECRGKPLAVRKQTEGLHRFMVSFDGDRCQDNLVCFTAPDSTMCQDTLGGQEIDVELEIEGNSVFKIEDGILEAERAFGDCLQSTAFGGCYVRWEPDFRNACHPSRGKARGRNK